MSLKRIDVKKYYLIVDLKINIKDVENENEPLIKFSDEIMYGIGNIVQNATEYAKSKINADISWNKKFLFLSIMDDGEGFTNEIIDKIGRPFISSNENSLGLGIFIAKNLIGNAGGNIEFSNISKTKGSEVKISLIRNI